MFLCPKTIYGSLCLAIAASGKAKTIYLAGFDGYQKGDRRLKIIEEIFNSYRETPGAGPITAITPKHL